MLRLSTPSTTATTCPADHSMCVCTFLGLQCWSQWGTLVPAQWCEICCEGFDVHQVTRILLQSCETWNMWSAWNQILHLSAASSCLRLQSSCSSFPPWFWQSPLMGRSFHLQGCGKWKGASPSEGAAKGKNSVFCVWWCCTRLCQNARCFNHGQKQMARAAQSFAAAFDSPFDV